MNSLRSTLPSGSSIQIPAIIRWLIEAGERRVSHTIGHTNHANPDLFLLTLRQLARNNPRMLDFVLQAWLIVDIGAGYSIPDEGIFSEYPIATYVAVDLCYTQLETAQIGPTRVIKKPGDFFSVLEWVPDRSIPCIYAGFLDDYILNREQARFAELIERKISPDGIFLYQT
jgi:hypothetical protein